MKHLSVVLTAAAVLVTLTFAFAQKPANPFLGRWDLTVKTANSTYPGWMEITDSGGRLAARIQPRAGGAFNAASVDFDGTHLLIKARGTGTMEFTGSGDHITGTLKQGDQEQDQIAGVRAPRLDRPMPKAWSNPEPIFNGKDLTGWEPTDAKNNHWTVDNGDLLNQSKGSNIKTTRKFQDFKLHIEFNCPNEGNSGVYLRGRYEVQVEYEPVDANDKYHTIGSIYSFVAPAVDLPRKPGTWETFDITLVGRHVTVIRDGVKTIDNQEIPGPTGGALDSNEADPGPFYIQGDHTGGMRYRNITVSLPK